MDALELLKKDHEKVEKLFQQIEEGATPTKSKTLFNQIYHELTIHAVVEEQVFYPALAKFSQLTDLLKDAYSEHAEAKRNMGLIANLDSASSEWKQKVLELKKAIEHHVNDEEDKLFPKVREIMGDKLLKELGAQIKQAKSSNLSDALLSQPVAVELTEQAHL